MTALQLYFLEAGTGSCINRKNFMSITIFNVENIFEFIFANLLKTGNADIERQLEGIWGSSFHKHV